MRTLLFFFLLLATTTKAQVFVSGGLSAKYPNYYYGGIGYSFYNNFGYRFNMLPSFQFEATYNRYKYRFDYPPYYSLQRVQQYVRLSPSFNIGVIQRKRISSYLTLGADYALHIDNYGTSGINPRAEFSIGYSYVLLRCTGIVPTAAIPDFNKALSNTDIDIGLVVFLALTEY